MTNTTRGSNATCSDYHHPYWNRPEMLRIWLSTVRAATMPAIQHFVYFAGGPALPEWWTKEAPANVFAIVYPAPLSLSIGHYHNLGAQQADTEWIMKLDVDALPNVHYFSSLLPILKAAQPRQWFNGGMLYLKKIHSNVILHRPDVVITEDLYRQVMSNRRTYSDFRYVDPAATNFICRKEDYLAMGGCDSRFKGYGWEDYQQIYALEYQELDRDPLPGPVTLENVTTRCRDEISRPKAKALWEKNPWLCLFHKWHPATPDGYRTSEGMTYNRRILFDRVIGHSFYHALI